MAVLGYVPKLKRGLRLAFSAHVHMSCMLLLHQWTDFQSHTFSASQNIKQNVLLSSYLGS